MPELPEVETIARSLQAGGRGTGPITGLRITAAELLWARTLACPGPEEFTERISGQTVQEAGRRGKFIRLTLEPDTLLLHLRMSGDIRVESALEPLQTHDRLILNFEDGQRMVFNDTRKFGRVWLLRDPDEVLGKLGPEPLDESFTADLLAQMLAGKSRQIKPLLLDQSFLAGMGNIYTDEALHQARIHPLRRASSLSREQVQNLWFGLRDRLSEGIRRNGASIDWIYRGGSYQDILRVYRRDGQPCPVCGTPVERILVGQRGTHYCPRCQPLLITDVETKGGDHATV